MLRVRSALLAGAGGGQKMSGLAGRVQAKKNKEEAAKQRGRQGVISSEDMGMNKMSDDMKEKMLKQLGLTEEEFKARSIKASEPYKVKKEKGTIDVHSSARVNQIVTGGTAERAVEKTKKELEDQKVHARVAFVMVALIAGCCMAAMMYFLILPIHNMRQKEYKRQQYRYEKIYLPSVQRLEREKKERLEREKAKEQQEQLEKTGAAAATQ